MGQTGDRDEHSTMMIYKALAEVLVNEQAALGFARLLLATRESDVELQRQEPLKIEDAGDFWAITGSAKPDYQGATSGSLVKGRAEIEISKYDGRIWKFGVNGHIAP